MNGKKKKKKKKKKVSDEGCLRERCDICRLCDINQLDGESFPAESDFWNDLREEAVCPLAYQQALKEWEDLKTPQGERKTMWHYLSEYNKGM